MAIDPRSLEIISLRQLCRGKYIRHDHEIEILSIHGNAVSSTEGMIR
jgi:hypothetical protein